MSRVSLPARARHCSTLLTPTAFAVLLALSPDAWAAAGKVLFATGDVQLNRNGTTLTSLSRGSELNPGDLVITGSTGFTQLLMEDGGRLTLRANSQLRLEDFVYAGKPDKQNRSLMSLLTGSMRAITGLIGHQNRESYKIMTPTATVGIRGSDGNIGFDPAVGASVQTLEGGHTLSSLDAQGRSHTLALNPGETGLVPPGGVPIKVPTFPFATTLAPQARARQALASTPANGSDSGSGTAAASGDTSIRTTSAAGEASGLATSTDTTPLLLASALISDRTASEPPALIDGSGGLLVTGPDGTPVIIRPDGGGTLPPPPQLGHSPKMSGVIGVTAWNSFDGLRYGRSDVDSQMLQPGQLGYDAANNLVKYQDDEHGFNSAYHEIKNGIAGPQQTSGAVTLGTWSSAPQGQTTFVEGWTLDNGGATSNWAWGTAGYYAIDQQNPDSFPLTGQMSYHAVNVGGRSFDGNSVSLNNATLNADFSNQLVNVSLDISAGGTQWQASASNLSLTAFGSQAYSNSFSASTYDGNLSLSNSSMIDAASDGQIIGSFTGANFSGALLRYDFMQHDSSGAGETTGVSGALAFKASGTVSGPGAGATPVDNPVVAVSSWSQGGSNGLQVSGLDGANVRGWAWASAGRQDYSMQFVGGTSTETGMLGSDIHLGEWQDGQIQQLITTRFDVDGSWQWGTLQRPQAWYLPALLSGTANYSTTLASVPRASDGSVWTLDQDQTHLQVDFTNQRVDARVTLTSSDSVVEAFTNGAVLHVADGQFSASTPGMGGGRGEGTLSIKRDGILLTNALGTGRLAGQLGGAGLSDALLGYGLSIFDACGQRTGCSDGFIALGGLAALSGPTQGEGLAFIQSDIAMTGSDGNALSTLGISSGSHFSSDAAGVVSLDAWPDFAEAVHLHRGNASVAESGSDAASGMSWGRWSGAAEVYDGSGTVLIGSASNVHYVNSQESGPALLPLSGSYSYTPVGHTLPTNQDGTTGVLNNATLTANFTTRMVDIDITAKVGSTELTGSGHNVTLFDNAFHASSHGGGTGKLNVSCAGICGAQNTGAITGHFSGNGAIGAGVSYSLGNSGVTVPTQINGVVAFQRAP